MSPPVILYRFKIQLSDVERSKYEDLDFRLAMHPSESHAFLISRMFAFILNHQEGLEFSAKGLADPEEPCISMPSDRGGLALWLEVGSPSARRLHKAAKAAAQVKVYTYKNPEALLREIEAEGVHNAHKLEIFSLEPQFLSKLEEMLERENNWSIIHDEGSLNVSIGEECVAGELRRHRVGARK